MTKHLTTAILGIVAILCTILATAQPAAAHHGPADQQHGKKPDKQCKDQYRHVKGQGLSCHVDGGLWKVKLDNGETVLTHGPDHLSAAASGARQIYSPDVVSRQPVCASNSNYFRAIVAVPSDVVGDKTVASFRADVLKADGVLYHAAVESGSPNGAHYRFMCDSTGAVRVDFVRLTTPASQGTWSTILTELKALGYNKTTEKYAIYYDAAASNTNASGEGSYVSDETDSTSNWSNVGPDYAVVYNTGIGTLIHEIGHNLGAVQYNAPYSTGNGGHCWESWDIMCYNDNGDKDPNPDSIASNCPDFDHFDCRHDSYFDAKIGAGQGGNAGSYIDTHWNIGECYVAWIVNYACQATTADTTPPTITQAPQELITGPLSMTSAGTRFSWAGTDNVGVTRYEARLRTCAADPCQATEYFTDMALSSPTATTFQQTLVVGKRYHFAVRAVDAAGNKSTWQYSPAFNVEAHDETSAKIAYSGAWTSVSNAALMGGTQKLTTTAGASATFSFTGRDVVWVVSKGPNGGTGNVSLDGGPVSVTSTLSYASPIYRIMGSRHRFTTSAPHTVKVTSALAGKEVTVDGFIVLR